MTVNGMGVAAKFILSEPRREVSKKDMPGQPSPAPGGFGFGNGALPAQAAACDSVQAMAHQAHPYSYWAPTSVVTRLQVGCKSLATGP